MRLSFLALSLALAACSGNSGDATAARPSGVTQGRSFAAAGFDKVSLRGPDNVVVRVGGAASVHASGDSAVLDRLDIVVVDGELRVARKRGQWIGSAPAATITVTLPAIRAASVAGSGNMTVDRAAAADFSAAVSGSGNLDIATVETRAADLAVSGSGNLTVAGTAGTVAMSVTGSGGIEAANLAGGTATISTVGSGDIVASVRTTADVSLVGSGNVTVRGGAQCTVSKLGSGDVDCG